MTMPPIAEPSQNGDTPNRLRPLRIITIVNTPINVPMIEPRPPYRLAPPITTAVIAASSGAVPANRSIDMICADRSTPATAASAPDITLGITE